MESKYLFVQHVSRLLESYRVMSLQLVKQVIEDIDSSAYGKMIAKSIEETRVTLRYFYNNHL